MSKVGLFCFAVDINGFKCIDVRPILHLFVHICVLNKNIDQSIEEMNIVHPLLPPV